MFPFSTHANTVTTLPLSPWRLMNLMFGTNLHSLWFYTVCSVTSPFPELDSDQRISKMDKPFRSFVSTPSQAKIKGIFSEATWKGWTPSHCSLQSSGQTHHASSILAWMRKKRAAGGSCRTQLNEKTGYYLKPKIKASGAVWRSKAHEVGLNDRWWGSPLWPCGEVSGSSKGTTGVTQSLLRNQHLNFIADRVLSCLLIYVLLLFKLQRPLS